MYRIIFKFETYRIAIMFFFHFKKNGAWPARKKFTFRQNFGAAAKNKNAKQRRYLFFPYYYFEKNCNAPQIFLSILFPYYIRRY